MSQNQEASFSAGIFDVDGTLLDSNWVWVEMNHLYLDRYLPGVPYSAINPDDIFHMTLYEAAVFLKEKFPLPYTTDEIMAQIVALADDFYENKVLCKPGIPQYLQQLTDRGCKLCVVTASERQHVEAALARCGILQHFSFILPCTEFGSGKESPAIFLEAAARLAAKPEQVMVFEDAPHAAKTASQAGFQVTGIYDSFAPLPPEEMAALCTRYIRSFEELL